MLRISKGLYIIACLLLAAFPPERRGHAVRTWTAIGGLAAALGPVIGGVLVTVNWRWIFLVNVPIGLVAMLVGWWKLPEVPGHEAPRPNPFDALLVTGGIGALTFAIVKVNDWGWRSPGIGISFIAAIVLLAWFVWRCLRSDSPFVDPALFRIRQFTGAALAIGVAIFVAIVGSPATPVERVAAFHRGWWILAPIASLGLIPTFFLIRPGRK